MSDDLIKLADLIRTRLIGIDPDSQDLVLEDHDWQLIVEALSRSPAPSGGVYVPREPTEAMLDAWTDAVGRAIFGGNGDGRKPYAEYIRDAYTAMLAAAPSTLALEPAGPVAI